MTVSPLFYILTPIVAVLALAGWLGMVFYADAHPEHLARSALVPTSAAGEGYRKAAVPDATSGAGAGTAHGDKDALTPAQPGRGDQAPLTPGRRAA